MSCKYISRVTDKPATTLLHSRGQYYFRLCKPLCPELSSRPIRSHRLRNSPRHNNAFTSIRCSSHNRYINRKKNEAEESKVQTSQLFVVLWSWPLIINVRLTVIFKRWTNAIKIAFICVYKQDRHLGMQLIFLNITVSFANSRFVYTW